MAGIVKAVGDDDTCFRSGAQRIGDVALFGLRIARAHGATVTVTSRLAGRQMGRRLLKCGRLRGVPSRRWWNWVAA